MPDSLQTIIQALEGATSAEADLSLIASITADNDLRLDALDLDSLSLFDVMMHIEQALDIELDEDEVSAHETVHGLAAFLDQRSGKV